MAKPVSEEERDSPSILVVFLVLVVQAEDSKQERQHEVGVARRVVFPRPWQVVLSTQSDAVDKRNTCNPVPLVNSLYAGRRSDVLRSST